nr:PREDICTED: uncharacterized protein LOC100879252 isoform X1 [Megachile rotundata]
MNNKTVEFDISSDSKNLSNKPNCSSSNNTKMFILPPDVLQNICMNDSKAESIVSAREAAIKDNNINNVRTQECNGDQIPTSTKNSTNLNIVIQPTTVIKLNKNNTMNDTDNESLKNTIKVPKCKKNDEKVISKVNHIKQVKHNSHTEKPKGNITVDSSVINSRNEKNLQEIKCVSNNVKNNQTTSNNIPKAQRTNSVSEQSSSENVHGRSKRVRKQTKFDDYIVSYARASVKKEIRNLDQKKKGIFNKEPKQESVSNSPLLDVTEVNDPNLTKCTKGELQNTQNKKNTSTAIPSITPVVTKKSLPFKSSNNSGDYTNVMKNENNFDVKRLQNSEDIGNKIKLEELKSTMESNNMNDNEVHMGAINTSVEHSISEEIDTLDRTKEDRMSMKISNALNQGNENTDALNQGSPDPILVTKPLVRKRGRPKKVMPILQQTPNTSDVSADNSEVSDNVNNVSIAEAVVHSKRHNRSYNICTNDGLSDDSSIEDNIPNSIVDRKGSSPASTSVSRGRGSSRSRGRGRGKGRSRGKGKELSYSSLDTEYVPKLKGPVTTDKVKQENSDADTISDTPKVELITCAKCEVELLKKQWNSHNLFKHNNTSWIKGDEPLDFENDIKLWRRVLTGALHKRRGQLICDKCGTVKRSVNGFISHTQFCGKSDEEKKALMVSCPTCGAVMMPSSMEIHERTHRQIEQNKMKELQIVRNENERVKRKAAEKAVSKILEFTELVKDNSVPPGKKIKLETSLLKNVVKTPNQSKNIPTVWKGIWKKELTSQGTAACRQMNCTYKSTSFEDICKHSTECSFMPKESYVCKICKFSSTSNENMVKHVTTAHSMVDETEHGSDYEEEHCSSDDTDTSNKINFYNMEQNRIHWREPYHPALRWTIEFEQKNYEYDLFTDYTPNHFILLNNTDAAKYLPELEISIRMKTERVGDKVCDTEIPWKQWKKFEGGFDKGVATFFVGGPVWALAWLPIPVSMFSKNPSQYIAISTHPTMESEYTVGKSYLGHNMIQIWNVGPLHYESEDKKKSPTLSYAITHNSGTVWCLEWCPSGCYQDESLNNYKKENEVQSSLKRIGMLAAACSDGNVYIYSLPFPEELDFKTTAENELPIYYTDPIMTLVVNISIYDSNDQNWQCTKLSWIKEHGHNTIAAGFSNGYIAVWDLTYKSPLSMQKRQNTWFINAFQYFYAHGNAVSMVALVPYNGERFLASGSIDKSYKFWDLEDTTAPQYSLQKGIILNGAWMTHWPCAIVTFDDALGYKHTNTYIFPLREHEYKLYPILATNSPTYALAVSDYANSIAHGTLAGEILTVFPHEILQAKELDKAIQKRRKLSSFVRIVDFSKAESGNNNDKQDSKNSTDYYYLPESYSECKDRFGIIFCDDLKNDENCTQRARQEKLIAVPVEEYPFMSVNRMSWNPNTWSYLWLAIGYQNGLVRLLSFKYMPVSRELKTLLPQHIKFMLNKSQKPVQKCYKKEES